MLIRGIPLSPAILQVPSVGLRFCAFASLRFKVLGPDAGRVQELGLPGLKVAVAV